MTFDYNDADVTEQILNSCVKHSGRPIVPLVLDCIGSQSGSVQPITKVAQRGAKVAILLPVIMKDSTENALPEYAMDVEKVADWLDGVEARGVRTHFYLEVSIPFIGVKDRSFSSLGC